ncbi:MAG: trypsin-like peptidase domain-containing protein [Thermodesulfobacteriota bacterium]
MNRATRWSVLITIAGIFAAGVVLGLWLNRQPPKVSHVEPVSPGKSYEALEAGEAVVMRVYKALSPTVVNIVATSLSLNYWLKVVPEVGQGTGFVFDDQGHILTNNHVVANAKELEVTFVGERKAQAKLVGRDPLSDLAVIKVEPFDGMTVATLGNSESLAVGQRVIAIGNPFGFQHTVTSGFISALNRDLTVGQRTMMGLIQTDAAINPGNSGGPLINSRGEVVGINTAIYTQSGGFVGLGFAMPINRAKRVAAQLVRLGRAIYPWIGLRQWIEVDEDLSRKIGLLPVDGVLIYDLFPASPGAIAGLRGGTHYAQFRGQQLGYRGRPVILGGDVILAVDGVPTPTYDELTNAIIQKEVGDTVKLHVLRDGRKSTVPVELAADPRIQQ